MFNFVRKIKNVFVPLKENRLQDIDLQPGDVLVCFQDGKPYGTCGCVFATQVDTSRQLEFNSSKQLEFKPA